MGSGTAGNHRKTTCLAWVSLMQLMNVCRNYVLYVICCCVLGPACWDVCASVSNGIPAVTVVYVS